MAVPETAARARVKSVVEAEFAPEAITVENDKLTRASGRDGRTRVAVYPEAAVEVNRNVRELRVEVILQYYLPFVDEPDENYVVDPATIEAVADRLRRAFTNQSSGTTADLWFCRLRNIRYPDDPTGNKSRLEAEITVWCDNPASAL